MTEPRNSESASEPVGSVPVTEPLGMPLPRAREPSVYDVPWKSDQDALLATRPKKGGALIVVTKQALRLSQLVYFRTTSAAADNKVWKSRVDYYNGKYIIKALRDAPVYPPLPQIEVSGGLVGEGGEGGEALPLKRAPTEFVVRVVIPNIAQLREFEQDIAAKKARIKDPSKVARDSLVEDEEGDSEESSEESLWTDDESVSSIEYDQKEDITPLTIMSQRKKITTEQLLERLRTDQKTLAQWRDELVEREIARQERERLEALAKLKEKLPLYGEGGEDDDMEWKFTDDGWIRVPKGELEVTQKPPEEIPIIEEGGKNFEAATEGPPPNEGLVEYRELEYAHAEEAGEDLKNEEYVLEVPSTATSTSKEPILKELSTIYLYAISLIPYPEQLAGRKRCITPFSNYGGINLQLEPSTRLAQQPLSFLNFSSLLDSICITSPTFFKIGKLTRSRGFVGRATLLPPVSEAQSAFSSVREDKLAILQVVDVDSEMNDQIVYMLVPRRALPGGFEPGEPADLIASEVEAEKMKQEAEQQALSMAGSEQHSQGDQDDDERFAWKAPPRFDVRQVKEKRYEFLELQKKDKTLEDIVNEFKKKETHRPDIALKPDPNVFHILTTVDYDSIKRPKIGRNSEITRQFVMRSCGTVIFDISRSKKDLFDAWCYLKQHMELLGKKDVTDLEETEVTRHLVLITSYLTWGKSPMGVIGRISPTTFLQRVPHPDYKDFYTLENFVYKIGKNPYFNLKTTIIFTGIPFGHEQDVFTYFFKVAWDNERELPLFGTGRNIPPIIHIDDLSQIVASVITSRSYPPFVWAVMPNDQSLMAIAKSISNKFGYSKVVPEPSPGYAPKFCLSNIINDLLKQNIRYDFVVDPYDFEPKLEKPFTANIMDQVLELEKERHLRESTVLLLGPPSKVKYEIAALLSRMYDVPLLHKGNIVNWFYKAYEGKNDAELPEQEAAEEDEEELEDEEEGEGEAETEDGIPPKLKKKKQHRGGEWAKQFFKSMIETPEQNADRKWLIKCLRKLLTSVFIQSHGYILIDLPIRLEDAERLFAPKPMETNPEDEDEEPYVEEKIDIPDYVIYVEAPDDHFDPKDYILKHDVDFKTVTDIVKDLDEYSYYRSINKSSVDFFEEKNHRIYRLNVTEGMDLVLKCFAIIGPPRQIHGLSMFTKFLHDQLVFNPFSRYREKHEKHLEAYFNKMEKTGINSLLESKINKKLSLREYFLDQPLLEYKEKELGVDTADHLNIQTDSTACGKARVKNRWRRKAEIFNCLEERAQNHYWHEFRRLWWAR